MSEAPAPASRVGLELRAPAKVNLGLRITARRPDGYHEIESLFVPVDLADELTLALVPGGRGCLACEVSGQDEGLPGGADNLAVRAALAFLDAAGLRYGVRMVLRKRIPAGAGLGGGSSDAGAVLRALSACFASALSRSDLEQLALSLGADVPFFLDARPALVRGIGERIEPLAGLPSLPLLLVTPTSPLPTAEVYAAYDRDETGRFRPDAPRSPSARAGRFAPLGGLTPDRGGLTMAALSTLRGSSGGLRRDALRRLLVNDLEDAAARLRPTIPRLRAQLRAAGALAVGMSGSGPTVFGVFGSGGAAVAARARFTEDATLRVHAVRTVGSEDSDRGRR